jgi:hypothetical protein
MPYAPQVGATGIEEEEQEERGGEWYRTPGALLERIIQSQTLHIATSVTRAVPQIVTRVRHGNKRAKICVSNTADS